MNRTGQVIVLTGPPGAGKSTVAALVAGTYPKAVHLHTDDFWHYIVAGTIPPYDPASDAQNQTVLAVIAQAAFTYARGGFVTIVDGIVGPWMLHHFQAQASRHPGTPVDYLVLRPRRPVTLARAQRRTAPDALVDEQPIVAMWDQFSELGAWEPHALDTSGETAGETGHRVATAVASGRFRLPPGDATTTVH